MRNFFIFYRFQSNLQSQQLLLDSYMDHNTCRTYKAAFSRELSNAIWKNYIREIPNFTIFQLYDYFIKSFG